MPVLAGFLPLASLHGYNRLYITVDLDGYAANWINNRVDWAALPSPGTQALTTHWPVSTTPAVRSGKIATSYFDDFYNRIHIAPRVLNIGNLLSVQTRQAVVWNAYFTGQALASIGEAETLGLTEAGITAPTTFAALEGRTYSVTVDTEGPATIAARYTFNFPLEAPTLDVTGRRVVVWGHPPDWSEPVREKLHWKTDVLTTQAGIEQRIGLRAAPRRGLEYALTTQSRQQSNRLEMQLLGWQARLYAVPVWTDGQTLSANLSAGSLTIPCVTSGYEFTASGLALLWGAADNYEAVEVGSIGASSITLKVATLAAWPAGTRLYPVRLGRLPQRQGFTRETAQHLSGRIGFAFTDNPGVTSADSGDTYAGYRVYLGRTNWADPIEISAERQLETLDYETGTPWVDDLSGLAALLKSWHWTLSTRAEIVALRGWLAARAGKLVPFWSAAQGTDMEVMAAIGASDGAITIRNIGYARYLEGRADCRHLVITTRAGARHYRAITAASEIDASSESLAIDSALGVTLQIADIASLRFLHLVRLDSDDIEIAWHTLGVAECSTLLRSLPN